MASYFCVPFRACGRCTEAACEAPCCPDHRPSPIFLGYTLLLNVVPASVAVVIAVLGSTTANKCSSHSDQLLKVFMFVAAGCSLFFIVFSIRAYIVLKPKPHEVYQQQGRLLAFGELLSGAQFSRFKPFLSKDVFMFFYMLVAPFAIVWSVLGLIWADAVDKDYTRKYGSLKSAFSQECFWVMIRMSKAQATIMLIYVCFTTVVVPFSWCIEQCRAGRRRPDVEHGQAQGMYIAQPPPPVANPITKPGASGQNAFMMPPVPATVVGHGSYGQK